MFPRPIHELLSDCGRVVEAGKYRKIGGGLR
jgi:hypothetical protein